MLSDVIAALSTPPGRSAIALIRVSGAGAHRTVGQVIRPFSIEPLRTARRASVVDPASGDTLDDVLYVVYRGPESYTGEDLVEISTHGGLLAPAEVLGAVVAAGSRPALPGEFTQRAVRNGKMDLLQAEAVADLIDATSAAQRRSALHQYDRGLTRRIGDLRNTVLDLEALVCYEIDFPEEDSGPVAPERVEGALRSLMLSLKALIETSSEGLRLREGALAVIAGRPNAGKSSLFNALIGAERAIVTELPGTTRDAIEAAAVCDGFPFRLVDTAGIREAGDTIEQLGIEVSRKYLGAADVVLFCVEAGRELEAEEQVFLRQIAAPTIIVRTKADLAASSHQFAVSAASGRGLNDVRRELARVAFTSLASQGDVSPVVTRARHRAALERALQEVGAFAEARAGGIPLAVAATHLRAAVTALDELIGLVTPDDVLGRVFSTFCVGK